MNKLHWLSLIALFTIIGLKMYRYFFKNWKPYYEKRMYQEPRPLLTQALQLYAHSNQKQKNALDLGAGSGNDTAFLLQNGWNVWANDREKEATQIISQRKDVVPHNDQLTLLTCGFSAIPWHTLPLFDLIYASYALPFINQSEFPFVWKKIIAQLKSNGILAIHLFGPKHQGFNWWERRNMTFFTKEAIMQLFHDFDIKFFNESYEKNDHGIWDHSFSIIGEKKISTKNFV